MFSFSSHSLLISFVFFFLFILFFILILLFALFVIFRFIIFDYDKKLFSESESDFDSF